MTKLQYMIVALVAASAPVIQAADGEVVTQLRSIARGNGRAKMTDLGVATADTVDGFSIAENEAHYRRMNEAHDRRIAAEAKQLAYAGAMDVYLELVKKDALPDEISSKMNTFLAHVANWPGVKPENVVKKARKLLEGRFITGSSNGRDGPELSGTYEQFINMLLEDWESKQVEEEQMSWDFSGLLAENAANQ